ncbi:hypothetical protein [Noviherbaspirillum galbum]|uniref:Uncharacterized protein n=1 Tax=Noviherbaspirillum galbum TaxID=2709383 RepID=A0A6B3SVH4_9BURK|nr:hypothetical protein [Noviherbaspirillum galbum]NEX61619.1 hypothetical protein [Noviherbaspirillum galbum]
MRFAKSGNGKQRAKGVAGHDEIARTKNEGKILAYGETSMPANLRPARRQAHVSEKRRSAGLRKAGRRNPPLLRDMRCSNQKYGATSKIYCRKVTKRTSVAEREPAMKNSASTSCLNGKRLYRHAPAIRNGGLVRSCIAQWIFVEEA